jgi:hypothetical protein
MGRLPRQQSSLLSAAPTERPAKQHRTDVDFRSVVNSKAELRNREVQRNKRSRKRASSVPFPQKDRIKKKFISEKNIREIATEEKRYRETVARFVKEEDVQEHVKNLRARFYGLLEEILLAVIEYVKKGKDGGWLGFEILKDAGVIPQRDSGDKVELPATHTPEEVHDYLRRKIAIGLMEGLSKSTNITECHSRKPIRLKKRFLRKRERVASSTSRLAACMALIPLPRSRSNLATPFPNSERVFNGALSQLERLQGIRLGQRVPSRMDFNLSSS